MSYHYHLDPFCLVWTIIYKDLDSFEAIIIELIQKIEANLKYELIEAFIEDNAYLYFVVKELEVLKDTDNPKLF